MNKYNLELENIIKKYFTNQLSVNTINPINLVGQIIEENCRGKKFAIWGAGEHTENLHKYFSVELKEAKFIIDNNKDLTNKKVLGFKVMHPTQVNKYDLDVILISSYAGGNSIEKQIKELNIDCKIINFYSILESKGLKLQGAFYSNPSIYMQLYEIRRKYENEEDKVKKEEYISKLIFLYLKIRDFFNAQIFIKKCIKCNLGKSKEYKMLLNELEQLFMKLKQELKNRKSKDIMLMFFDGVRYIDTYSNNMKYLRSILKESIYFENACSPSIFTYESVPSMFKNSMPFKESLYKRKVVNQNECEFLKIALEKGFKIKIYALSHWGIIEGKNIEHGEESNYTSETFWNAICDLVESKEQDTLYLLYFWQETHPPHICGYHSVTPLSHITPFACNDIMNQTQEEYNIQYYDGLKYIDNQLKFYNDIISKSTTKVIFSDHGQIIEKALQPLNTINTLAGWHRERYNVTLIINGGNIVPKRIKGLYSTKNLGNIIKGIINDDLSICTDEIVEVNFSRINNSVIIEKYKKAGYEDYLYGFKVFISEKYKLVLTGNGKTKVYLKGDELNEIKENNKIQQVVKYFKNNNCDLNIPKF